MVIHLPWGGHRFCCFFIVLLQNQIIIHQKMKIPISLFVSDFRYQENCFKEARLSQPILCVAPEQPPLLPDTILHNISSISLQEPSCSFPSEPSVSSSPCDKLPATTNSQSCSIQARACYDDTSMSELASYFDVYCHIPKKMSHMAEMMYT